MAKTPSKRKKQRQIEYIRCPVDPELMYDKKVCEEFFRKGKIRPWCKNCKIFK